MSWTDGGRAEIRRVSGDTKSIPESRSHLTKVPAQVDESAENERSDVPPYTWSFLGEILLFTQAQWGEGPLASLAFELGLNRLDRGVMYRLDPNAETARPILATHLDLVCPEQVPQGLDLFCLVHDRSVTRLARLDFRDAADEPLVEIVAVMPGWVWDLDLQFASGWILIASDGGTYLWRRPSGRAFALPASLESRDTPAEQWALADSASGEPLLAQLDAAGDLVLYALAEPSAD